MEASGLWASLMWLLSRCAGADPQDGHVLRSDGQPPAQRRQADAVRQPAGALRRPVLLHLPQPAALPLQLSLHGSSGPGQPLSFCRGFRGDSGGSHSLALFQLPHEVASQSSADSCPQLSLTRHYYELREKKEEEEEVLLVLSAVSSGLLHKYSQLSISYLSFSDGDECSDGSLLQPSASSLKHKINFFS